MQLPNYAEAREEMAPQEHLRPFRVLELRNIAFSYDVKISGAEYDDGKEGEKNSEASVHPSTWPGMVESEAGTPDCEARSATGVAPPRGGVPTLALNIAATLQLRAGRLYGMVGVNRSGKVGLQSSGYSAVPCVIVVRFVAVYTRCSDNWSLPSSARCNVRQWSELHRNPEVYAEEFGAYLAVRYG